VVPVPPARLLVFGQLGQPVGAVLPQRLQHPVPGAGRVVVLADQDGLVDQGGEQAGEVAGDGLVLGTHVFDRVQVETRGEHRQPGPQPPLRAGAQVMAPVDAATQGLLPVGDGMPAAVEQGQPAGRPVADLGG